MSVLVACFLLFGCGSDGLTVDPVNVCRCEPDQICVNETCVTIDARLLDAPDTQIVSSCVREELRINELRYAGNAFSDFVELSGPVGTDLEGYRLLGSDGQGSRRVDVTLSGVIDDSGLWVASFGDAMETSAHLDLGAPGFAAPVGSVELFDCAGNRLDRVGYGVFTSADAFRGEGDPAPETAADQALARCPGADSDTDDNAYDFLVDSASPGEANTRLEGSPRCVGCGEETWEGTLWINEVLYDPAGADDQATAFVELRGEAGAMLSDLWLEAWTDDGWTTLGELGGGIQSDGYVLIADEDVLPGTSIVFEGVDTPNDRGGFRLLGCGGLTVDAMAYGNIEDISVLGLDPASLHVDVEDGRSLARGPDPADAPGAFGDGDPTPGDANLCAE